MVDGIRSQMLAQMPRLRRFAYGLTGSVDDGDDLVQATYERAITNIARWQPGTRLDSWMFRIARNLFLNRLRAAKVRGEHLAVIDPDDLQGNDGRVTTEAWLTLADVRLSIARLPEEQRAVLLLVAVEGYSYKETSEILGLPVGTVTSRLGRARLSLRAMSGAPSTDAARPTRSRKAMG